MIKLEITEIDVDEIRAMVDDNRVEELANITLNGLTLIAALELACSSRFWLSRNERNMSGLIDRWSTDSPALAHSLLAIIGRQRVSNYAGGIFDAPESEIFSVPNVQEISSPDWLLFHQRFKRSLAANGFSVNLSLALTKSFDEMIDNVLEHSIEMGDDNVHGIVGYHVTAKQMTYAVADLGQGVLNSLRTNPKWHHLLGSLEALRLAVCQGATRRTDEVEGNGFRQVHLSLADLNGRLRFRSGDAALVLEGDGNKRQVTGGACPLMPGFQLSVTCCLASNRSAMFLS